MVLGPQLDDHTLHAVLTKKRKIFDISAVAWYAVHLYMTYTFELCMREKKKKKKKKETRKEKKNSKIEIFAFDFLDCEEK